MRSSIFGPGPVQLGVGCAQRGQIIRRPPPLTRGVSVPGLRPRMIVFFVRQVDRHIADRDRQVAPLLGLVDKDALVVDSPHDHGSAPEAGRMHP